MSNVYSQKGVTPLALLALKNTCRIHVFVQSQKGVSVFSALKQHSKWLTQL